jgi:hypothetical protein
VEARDAEVDQRDPFDRAAAQEQVRRLDVAMDNAALVQAAEDRGDPPREVDGLPDGQGAGLEPARQRLPLEPFGHQVLLAGLGGAVRHVADHARVVELCEQLRLALEAVADADSLAQDLDRDLEPGGAVHAAVDQAHPALAGQSAHLEATAVDGAEHSRDDNRSYGALDLSRSSAAFFCCRQ